MAEEEFGFTCTNDLCKMDNWVTLDASLVGKQKIILYCCNCGKVSEPKGTIVKKPDGNWLPCIPFTGIESDETAGFISSGTTTLWVDADGKNLTREEFANQHGVDPWTTWCSRPANQNKPMCKGYADRCKGNKKKTILDPSDDDNFVIR